MREAAGEIGWVEGGILEVSRVRNDLGSEKILMQAKEEI